MGLSSLVMFDQREACFCFLFRLVNFGEFAATIPTMSNPVGLTFPLVRTLRRTTLSVATWWTLVVRVEFVVHVFAHGCDTFPPTVQPAAVA